MIKKTLIGLLIIAVLVACGFALLMLGSAFGYSGDDVYMTCCLSFCVLMTAYLLGDFYTKCIKKPVDSGTGP